MKDSPRSGISIIIPAKDSRVTIGRLLAALKSAGTPLEIIIVNAQSEDGTEQIAKQFNAKFVRSTKGRSGAKNVGAAIANNPNLLFLDSDMAVSGKILNECLNLLNTYDAIIFPEDTVGENFLAKIRKFVRDGYLHTLYLEAPRCFSKRVFTSLLGYDEEMEGFEDLELTGRIINNGFKVGWGTEKILHDESNVSIIDFIKKRKFYMSFRTNFKNKNGEYYDHVFSLSTRAKAIYNSIRLQGMVKSMIFLPATFILFSLDLITPIFRW